MSENILKNKEAEPVADFLKKEKVEVPPGIMSGMSVQIPAIYYWEDVFNRQSVKMTMAFKIYGRVFGLSYPIEDDNFKKIEILRSKLWGVVKESLDVLVHHGEKILDSFGNINPRLVRDEEALRFKYDQFWDKKVAAFNQLVRIAPITKEKAVKLGLLDKPKIL